MSTRKRNHKPQARAGGEAQEQSPQHHSDGEEAQQNEDGPAVPRGENALSQSAGEEAGGGRPADNGQEEGSGGQETLSLNQSKQNKTSASGNEGGSINWQSQAQGPKGSMDGPKKNSARASGGAPVPALLASFLRGAAPAPASAKTAPTRASGTPRDGQLPTRPEGPERKDLPRDQQNAVASVVERELEYVRMSAEELRQYSEWRASQGQGAATVTFTEVQRTTFTPASKVVTKQDPVITISDDENAEEVQQQHQGLPQSSPKAALSHGSEGRDAVKGQQESSPKSTRVKQSTATLEDSRREEVFRGQQVSGKVCQKPIGSPKTLTPARKRQIKETKCPRCGNTDPQHDWMSCKEHTVDFPRSAAENEFLKQMTIMRRMVSKAKKLQRKELSEDSEEEGEDLDQDEEEEDDDEEEDEEDDDAIVEEGEEESASYSKSSSSDPSYHPSTADSSISRPEKMSKADKRLERMEAAITKLTTLVMDRDSRDSRPGRVDRRTGSIEGTSARASRVMDHSEFRPGTAESTSLLTHAPGMEGCPELQRDDLLKLSKFEEFEKKYKEYLDKAADRRRTSHNMVYGFRKFAFELRQYIRTLFGKSHTLRETYFEVLPSFELSEEEFLDLPNETFRKLYREICTHHSCLPSQVLQSLETIRFQRGVQGDSNTLPALVVQASAAFRERLRELPRQTVSQCTQKQLKEAFIRMLLGPDERNLADFPLAQTWEHVISCLLDLEGTSEANTLVQKIRQVGKNDKPNKEEDPSAREERSGGAVSRHRPRQAPTSSEEPSTEEDSVWKPQFEKLMAEFKPTQQQLQGCVTYHQKVLRILQIRDTKKREQELKEMRTSVSANADGATETPLTKSVSTKSRSQVSEEGPVCFFCKQKGHYKRDCPKREKTGDSDGENP
jgi:hypothetical protein